MIELASRPMLVAENVSPTRARTPPRASTITFRATLLSRSEASIRPSATASQRQSACRNERLMRARSACAASRAASAATATAPTHQRRAGDDMRRVVADPGRAACGVRVRARDAVCRGLRSWSPRPSSLYVGLRACGLAVNAGSRRARSARGSRLRCTACRLRSSMGASPRSEKPRTTGAAAGVAPRPRTQRLTRRRPGRCRTGGRRACRGRRLRPPRWTDRATRRPQSRS